MQQKVDLNLSGEISPPQLDHQRVQKPIQISDQESSRKPAGGQRVQIITDDQYQEIQEINDFARETENQIYRQARNNYRPKSSQIMQKIRSHQTSVTRNRLASAAGLRSNTAQSKKMLRQGSALTANTKRMFPRRPLSNIFKNLKTTGPDQTFKRYIENSEKMQNEQAHLEMKDSYKRMQESSEGILKPRLRKPRKDLMSHDLSPDEDEPTERESISEL